MKEMARIKFNYFLFLTIVILNYNFTIYAQVVYSIPQFPTQKDTITLFFDAYSTTANDWQHVVGEWGADDQRTLMKKESDNLYSLTYGIENFYQLKENEIVEQLAFVFRNEDGSIVGRARDGSDIFLPIFSSEEGILVNWLEPVNYSVHHLTNDLFVRVELEDTADVQLFFNDELFATFYDKEVITNINFKEEGNYAITLNIEQSNDTLILNRNIVVINKNTTTKDVPNGIAGGLNYNSDSTFIFKLTAPLKQYAFFLTGKNNFQPDINYRMNISKDRTYYWIELPKSIFKNGNTTYQYLVNNDDSIGDGIRIADPFSSLILDPVNDRSISEIERHDLPAYPNNTVGNVSIIDREKPNFNWSVEDFKIQENNNLVIYEILMRDFLDNQQYRTLADSLDHFKKLGINAIELMPIQEFEGNQSWGYNPSYHQALDKAYGTRDELKTLIDECHKRDIAVVIDVVFNHAFSQSPLCKLYWDAANFQPDNSNPYFNTEARHPFNVGYDANHESTYTKAWVKQILTYWLEVFKIDGFRFDLSKGFTQKFSGNDAELMSRYDQSRIDILKEYADHIWSINEDGLIILEHFADSDEERVLAEYGMLLWNNIQYQFAEAAMGYSANLTGADYQYRGFTEPNLVTYLESHDEERLAYKISQWGNSEVDYDTKELATLTERMVATYTIFMSIPGPKMIWQFSEFGYDYSINRCVSGETKEDCRLDPKPVFWNEVDDPNRQLLFEKLSALLHLKTGNPAFATTDYAFNDHDPYLKSVHLFHPEMDVISIANFDVKQRVFEVDFPDTGIWYEFYSGKELTIENEKYTFNLKPGDYRIYTSKPNQLGGQFPVSVEGFSFNELNIFPNPVTEVLNIETDAQHIIIWNAQGIVVKEESIIPNRINPITLETLPEGLYFIQAIKNNESVLQNFIKL